MVTETMQLGPKKAKPRRDVAQVWAKDIEVVSYRKGNCLHCQHPVEDHGEGWFHVRHGKKWCYLDGE